MVKNEHPHTTSPARFSGLLPVQPNNAIDARRNLATYEAISPLAQASACAPVSETKLDGF